MNAIETIIEQIRPTVASVTGDFYPNVVTFTAPVGQRDSTGQLVDSTFEPVDGLVDLRAMILSQAQYAETIQAAQMFGPGLSFNSGDYIVFLGAFYDNITSSNRMVDEDGVEYEVTGVRDDPFDLMTVLTAHRSDLTDGS